MRSLPDPGFAADNGAADPDLTLALTAYASKRRGAPVLVALSRSRLLVPVVALLGASETGASGLTTDKSADVAAVLLRGRDGRTALLAFTSLAALQTWNGEARPVPVTVRDAARSARSEGADALVVDVAGPVMFVVEGDDLAQLADGRRLTETSVGYAWLVDG